jgi:hypothetical protein
MNLPGYDSYKLRAANDDGPGDDPDDCRYCDEHGPCPEHAGPGTETACTCCDDALWVVRGGIPFTCNRCNGDNR